MHLHPQPLPTQSSGYVSSPMSQSEDAYETKADAEAEAASRLKEYHHRFEAKRDKQKRKSSTFGTMCMP